MARLLRKVARISTFALLLSGAALAQTSSLEGDVIGEDGQPLKGAMIKIDRTDTNGSYKVKTDKKGHYFHAGLPLGTYDIILEVDGKDVDKIQKVRSRLGDPVVNNFSLQRAKQQQNEISQALPFDATTNSLPAVVAQETRAVIFVSKDDPKDTLELLHNKSFRLFERGRRALGQYEWSGATLTLIIGKKRYVAHLAGDILTDNEGKLWHSTTNSVPVGATHAARETPMAEPPPPPLPPSAEPQTPPKTIEVGQTIEQVIAALGQPAKIVKLGTKELYFYKDLKITFVNGKVSDVE